MFTGLDLVFPILPLEIRNLSGAKSKETYPVGPLCAFMKAALQPLSEALVHIANFFHRRDHLFRGEQA